MPSLPSHDHAAAAAATSATSAPPAALTTSAPVLTERRRRRRRAVSSASSLGSPAAPAAAPAEPHSRRRHNKRKKRKHERRSSCSSSSSPGRTRLAATRAAPPDPARSSSSGSESSSASDGSGRSSSPLPDDPNLRRKLKSRKVASEQWALLNAVWPIEDRPKELRKRSCVRKPSQLHHLLQYKTQLVAEREKRGGGEPVFSKDAPLAKVRFSGGSDNGFDKLHPARFLRQPCSLPVKFYKQVPRKREPLVRHFPTAHLGIPAGFPEKVVAALHDRHVQVKLDNFIRPGADRTIERATLHEVQDGVLNYRAAMFCIWPQDYTPIVIEKVLLGEHWGDKIGGDERRRCTAVRRFFDEVMMLNCSNAVNDLPPVDFTTAAAVWTRIAAAFGPITNYGGDRGGGDRSGGDRNSGNSRPGGGNRGRGSSRGRPGNRGSAAQQVKGAPPPGTAAARVNGVECCWPFNSASGCSRPAGPNSSTCRHGSYLVFAHFCNFWDASTSAYCLQAHSRSAPGQH